jgi:hypothetical protein
MGKRHFESSMSFSHGSLKKDRCIEKASDAKICTRQTGMAQQVAAARLAWNYLSTS